MSLVTIEVITPRDFHTHAKEFFTAAEAVYVSPKAPQLPLAFLWGRSIELLLKSYLFSAGISVERLRSREFGHNLVALHREARERGIDEIIGSDSTVAGLLRLLNLEYGTKRLEYREKGTYYLPDAETTRTLIQRLIRGINSHLRTSK